MAHIHLREKAIQLRLQGYTYSQIKKELNLSKSTLSDWLSKLPLSQEQQIQLIKNKTKSEEIRVEKFRLTSQIKRLTRLKKVLEFQSNEMLPLSDRELFIAGIFLYWGEGSKHRGLISISNTNPQLVKFAMYWMVKILHVPKKRLKIRLHLYSDMDCEKEIGFWSKYLKFPKSQFKPSYIKESTRDKLTYKSFGHGTCNLYVSDVTLSEKVAMSIKAISEEYGAKSELFWYN